MTTSTHYQLANMENRYTTVLVTHDSDGMPAIDSDEVQHALRTVLDARRGDVIELHRVTDEHYEDTTRLARGGMDSTVTRTREMNRKTVARAKLWSNSDGRYWIHKEIQP